MLPFQKLKKKKNLNISRVGIRFPSFYFSILVEHLQAFLLIPKRLDRQILHQMCDLFSHFSPFSSLCLFPISSAGNNHSEQLKECKAMNQGSGTEVIVVPVTSVSICS